MYQLQELVEAVLGLRLPINIESIYVGECINTSRWNIRVYITTRRVKGKGEMVVIILTFLRIP